LFELENDPTFFSEISQRYQTAVEFLLNYPDSCAPRGITHGELAHFQNTYGPLAFICRYRNCPRALNGFWSAGKRDQHELTHTRRLKCVHPTCAFYVYGFTSQRALQIHNETYHTMPND